ncbi:diguanylate cyclase [Shewanella salipaludis]|uniref:diguanylate cyclase n=1 Tax=Shewanella salipaludis TaxID=2723052 RepID=A0A972G8F7_9GAMM|nr:diguanylate cyclase [Shewanella salipaludis]NMH66420.1 diguanylate cyclase [Shewanella salipaludis]
MKNPLSTLALSFLLGSCLWVHFPLQAADPTPTADDIFALLESGAPIANAQAKAELGKLRQLLAGDDEAAMLRLTKLECWAHDQDSASEIDAAIDFADAHLAMARIQSHPNTWIDILLCKSWYSQQKGLIAQAGQGYDKALAAAQDANDPRLLADAHNLRGNMKSFQGDFALALDDLIAAQHLYDQLGLDYWGQYNLNDLATAYRRLGDYPLAIKYYLQLEQSYEARGDKNNVISTNTDIALALEESGDYEQALGRYLQSYHYWQGEQKTVLAAQVAAYIGNSLLKLDRVDAALGYLNQAQQQLPAEAQATRSFLNLFLAEASFKQGQPDQALDYLNRAEAAFDAIHNVRGLSQLYALKSRVHGAKQDWQQAFAALEQYVAVHRDLDAKLQAIHTTEMRTRFDSERMETENHRLQENQRLKEHELKILEQNKMLQRAVISLSAIILGIVSLFAFRQVRRSRNLETLAHTDHLTQLPNRRHSYATGQRELTLAQSQRTPLAVILFDADHFKQINDGFGHEIGDKALVTLANISTRLMRKQDLVGRVGGEEFLVILPDTSLAQAEAIARRLVDTVAREQSQELPSSLTLTVSAGVAALTQEREFGALLKRADRALYQAKSSGRNCVRQAS